MTTRSGTMPPVGGSSLGESGKKELSSTLREVFRRLLAETDGMIPAEVIGPPLDGSRKVPVLPLIDHVGRDGQSYPRAAAIVPVATFGGGGFFAAFPVAIGDRGFLFAGDRDLTDFWESGGERSTPPTGRMQDFADGVFLPLKMFDVSIAGEIGAEGVSLQSDDGQTVIGISEGEVVIKASKIRILGDVSVSGDVSASGDVLAFDAAPVGAVSLGKHVHNVTTEGAPTSGPVPGDSP